MVPFFKGIVLKFVIGADPRIADKPVYMSCTVLYLLHESHHILIGRHICLQNDQFFLILRAQALPECISLIRIMGICGKDQIIFVCICQYLFHNPPSNSGGTSCNYSYSIHNVSILYSNSVDLIDTLTIPRIPTAYSAIRWSYTLFGAYGC